MRRRQIRCWTTLWLTSFRWYYVPPAFEEQLVHVEAAAKETAVLRSANMSMGINLLLKLLRDASRVLAPAGFDIEIVERHHNQKLDAPSGTALALADAVNDSLDNAIIML